MFLLFIILFLVSFGLIWLGLHAFDSDELVFSSVTIGGVMLVTAFSFVVEGSSIHRPVPYLIEKTPYRLIVSADGLERIYKDALSVSRADHVKSVNVVIPCNIWGIEMTSQRTLEIVFDN